ncbi:hypothetical protein [Dysgonomonas macrotermitis]|uniref:Uncharacterized protein n=1 Tax=Dysgonomonas macrotermitis TaxID=1346286 RepID=A0A1M4ZAF6_9BACT|nr:hypothetical protein [Dysgonomonas macrotermitis]SHF15021.1 hypothetical protein SAMN05444362_10431 [Dysgonomonas macrotermitis]
MKLTGYIAAVSLTLISLEAIPCGSYSYKPSEYYTFYTTDKFYYIEQKDAPDPNITEWQQYVSGKATYEDVYDVVYKYSYDEMSGILGCISRKDSSRNSFVQSLIDTRDTDAVEYLMLAKRCEITREHRNDKWWYPSKEDMEFNDLQPIVDQALAYKGTKFGSRYMLQAIRAAYTMGEDSLCIDIWDRYLTKAPESAVKRMSGEYIGGIYFKRGDYDRAMQLYSQGDYVSTGFWWSANKTAKSDIDRIKVLYKYNPRSPELDLLVQNICREAEVRANEYIFDGSDYSEEFQKQYGREDSDWGYGYTSFRYNRVRYMELRDFALEAAADKQCGNRAMWQYAAAFLTLLDNDVKLAKEYITKAEQLPGTPLVKTNIKILHVMMDALTGSYDAAFDARMLPHLKWLCGLVESNISDRVINEYDDNWVFDNYSFYYYNDMLRKLTVSIMAPRYMKKGRDTQALLTVGMSSEYLRTLIRYREKHPKVGYGEGSEWNPDFYTDVFGMMDTVRVESLIKYKQILNKGGNTPSERFMAAKCYKNDDYYNEVIGTKYMRILRFDKAVEYLSKVSKGYDRTLNIFEYFYADPFGKYKSENPISDYKLSYATQMLDLERIMSVVRNSDMKAEAAYRYALGISMANEQCWALLRYYNGNNYNFKNDRYDLWGATLSKSVDKYVKEATSLTNNKLLTDGWCFSNCDRYASYFN